MSKPTDADRILSPSAAEGILTVAKTAAGAGIAAMGAPPGTDGVAVALIDSVMRPLMGKRYTNFANGVMERMEKLEIDFEKLAKANAHFATVYLEAAREAVVTYEQEKVEALRNAVVNAAMGIDIEEQVQLMLIGMAGQLQAIHLRCLQYVLVEPQISMGGGVLHKLQKDMDSLDPALQQQLAFAIVRDLQQRGLVSGGDTVTPLGKALLKWIATPTELA